MQDKKKYNDRKSAIMNALAETVKDLRGKRSQFIFGSENDISTSILSLIEHWKKEPQLTTIFRLAEAFDLSCIEFIKLICDKLPKNFKIIEK